MRVQFVKPSNGPERHLADAEIVFDEAEGILAGMKLVGFSLWGSPDGDVYVTFPSRSFGSSTDRKYFDYLRSVEGLSSDTKRVKRVKDFILSEYRAAQAALPACPHGCPRADEHTHLAGDGQPVSFGPAVRPLDTVGPR